MFKNKKQSEQLDINAEKLSENFLQADILTCLREMKFKRKFFGGVDEADVWKKIGELNNLYERALLVQMGKGDLTEKGDSNE